MSAGNRIRGLIGAVTAAGLAAVVIGLQPVPADSAPQMRVPSLSVQVKPSGTSAIVAANAGVARLPSASVRAGTNSDVSLQTGASVLPPISAAAQAGPGSPSIGASIGNGPVPEAFTAGTQAAPATASGDFVSALVADPPSTSGGDPTASVGAEGTLPITWDVAVKQDPLADPNGSAVCPLLVFRPLVKGCKSILDTITGRALAWQ